MPAESHPAAAAPVPRTQAIVAGAGASLRTDNGAAPEIPDAPGG